MNFTKALSGNFSTTFVECYQFGNNWWIDAYAKYVLFNRDIGSYLLAFLFNQMGNALNFKNIIDEINQDYANQYYTDIAYQYGRLVRKIFDFQPLATSSLFSLFNTTTNNNTAVFAEDIDKSMAASSYPGALAF